MFVLSPDKVFLHSHLDIYLNRNSSHFMSSDIKLFAYSALCAHPTCVAERRLIDTLREGQQWVVTFELSSRNFL